MLSNCKNITNTAMYVPKLRKASRGLQITEKAAEARSERVLKDLVGQIQSVEHSHGKTYSTNYTPKLHRYR